MTKTRRYFLVVPAEMVDYALRHGAQFDQTTQSFYIDGDIPEPLEKFTNERVERTHLPRQRPPKCPVCRSGMVERRSRLGSNFWGCSRFPYCRKTLPFELKRLDVDEILLGQLSTKAGRAIKLERAGTDDYIRIVKRAHKILGDEHFEDWLFSPHAGIENLWPVDLLGTKRGVALVERLLVKLEELGIGRLPLESSSDEGHQ